MILKNANSICKQHFRLATNCKGCPIKVECDEKPTDPYNCSDWEEKIEQAAIKYLKEKENETSKVF